MVRSKMALSVTTISVPLSARMRLTSGEREHGVERDGDAAGANDGEKPAKTAAVVGAIDGYGLAGLDCYLAAKEGVFGADFRVQLDELIGAAVFNGDLRIAIAAE